jgi:phosphoribosylglycinamide formyltransferase-1
MLILKKELNMVIFVGKNGSHAINLYKKGFNIEEIFTNREDSYVFEYFKDKVKVSLTTNLEKDLKKYKNSLIILAGYMKKVPKEITENYKIINIHPSYLPYFKGLNAAERSYKEKKGTGLTIHFVNEEIDGGEIIIQKKINAENLSFEEYIKKEKEEEYRILPSIIVDIIDQYDFT